MPSEPAPLVVVTASLLALFAFVTATYGFHPVVWYGIGVVYVLTPGFVAGARYRLDGPPEFVETIAVAAVVVAVVVSVSSLLLRDSGSSLLSVVALRLRWLVPLAFMLPLGAAATWRQHVGTLAVVVLPTMSHLLYWSVFQPEALLIVGYKSIHIAVVGAPLFLFGRALVHPSKAGHADNQPVGEK